MILVLHIGDALRPIGALVNALTGKPEQIVCDKYAMILFGLPCGQGMLMLTLPAYQERVSVPASELPGIEQLMHGQARQ